jgi:hypothetical protein
VVLPSVGGVLHINTRYEAPRCHGNSPCCVCCLEGILHSVIVIIVIIVGIVGIVSVVSVVVRNL